jgi:hypothetical protein
MHWGGICARTLSCSLPGPILSRVGPTFVGDVPELADGPALEAGGRPGPCGFEPRLPQRTSRDRCRHLVTWCHICCVAQNDIYGFRKSRPCDRWSHIGPFDSVYQPAGPKARFPKPDSDLPKSGTKLVKSGFVIATIAQSRECEAEEVVHKRMGP